MERVQSSCTDFKVGASEPAERARRSFAHYRAHCLNPNVTTCRGSLGLDDAAMEAAAEGGGGGAEARSFSAHAPIAFERASGVARMEPIGAGEEGEEGEGGMEARARACGRGTGRGKGLARAHWEAR